MNGPSPFLMSGFRRVCIDTAAAPHTDRASFAISEGWKDNGPRAIQDREPMSSPTPMTSTRRRRATATNRNPGAQARSLAGLIRSAPHITARPTRTITACRRNWEKTLPLPSVPREVTIEADREIMSPSATRMPVTRMITL